MAEFNGLSLKIDHNCISVADPQTGEQITYSREGSLLVAHDLGTCSPSFLAKAWRAAHAEALKIGWLRS